MVETLPSTYSATKDQTTIHNGDREAITSRLNARDLVANVEGWQWGPAPKPAVAGYVPEPVAAPEVVVEDVPDEDEEKPGSQSTLVDAEDLRSIQSGETEPMAPVDVNALHLTDASLAVTGSDDVSAYLSGFPFPTLRSLAKEKFEHIIHHRATKNTAVAKLVELEEARILATADA